MCGGFLPQLTAAYNIAKVIKPASRISEIVDIIPGAHGKLEGNAFGQVFLKGLDLGKSFGFGHPNMQKGERDAQGWGLMQCVCIEGRQCINAVGE